MPAGLISFLGGLLRAAPFIICFAIGWQTKTTLVELKEARLESTELKEAKADRDKFEKQLKEIQGKYKDLQEDLNEANCTRELSDCAVNYIDKLFAQ